MNYYRKHITSATAQKPAQVYCGAEAPVPEPEPRVKKMRHHKPVEKFTEEWHDPDGLAIKYTYCQCNCGDVLVVFQDGILADDEHWDASDEIKEARGHMDQWKFATVNKMRSKTFTLKHLV